MGEPHHYPTSLRTTQGEGKKGALNLPLPCPVFFEAARQGLRQSRAEPG